MTLKAQSTQQSAVTLFPGQQPAPRPRSSAASPRLRRPSQHRSESWIVAAATHCLAEPGQMDSTDTASPQDLGFAPSASSYFSHASSLAPIWAAVRVEEDDVDAEDEDDELDPDDDDEDEEDLEDDEDPEFDDEEDLDDLDEEDDDDDLDDEDDEDE
ncbi:hypothetical protein [Acidisarcina polymorpha]|uniref:hypothetical protein n=1 Tax=Acidisarcina polymorpha TaxID=2211140 RepID=UPI00191C4A2C|nr:hypothetical protein [Acidisarcina polymorpha]